MQKCVYHFNSRCQQFPINLKLIFYCNLITTVTLLENWKFQIKLFNRSKNTCYGIEWTCQSNLVMYLKDFKLSRKLQGLFILRKAVSTTASTQKAEGGTLVWPCFYWGVEFLESKQVVCLPEKFKFTAPHDTKKRENTFTVGMSSGLYIYRPSKIWKNSESGSDKNHNCEDATLFVIFFSENNCSDVTNNGRVFSNSVSLLSNSSIGNILYTYEASKFVILPLSSVSHGQRSINLQILWFLIV